MTERHFEQVAAQRYPSGKESAIANIRLTPGQLRDRLGLEFSRGVDDLDEFAEAIVRLRSGRHVWLLGRPGDAYGVDVYMDSRDDACAAIDEVAAAFRLSASELQAFGGEGGAS